jgi:XTP/dITP diphosphohydrolase
VKTLTIATTNPGKIHEVRLALCDLPGWKIDPLPAGIPELEESGTTFLENATMKAAYYSRFVEGLALADDSGLCVKSLGNRPGVWTDRYGPTPESRNQSILNELAASADREVGFDPIFLVPGLRKTLAQMTSEEKNLWSARGKALNELKRFLSMP